MQMLNMVYQEKIAVLLIDMQNVFVDNLRPGAKERIIHKQIEVVRKAIKNNISIYVVELMRLLDLQNQEKRV